MMSFLQNTECHSVLWSCNSLCCHSVFLKKDIIALFKSEGLSITIETNVTKTDFLDVSQNLKTEELLPYRKPDNRL